MRIATVVLAGVLLAASGTALGAESAQDAWLQPEGKSDCRIWTRHPVPANVKSRVTWSGACKEGLAQGDGTFDMFISDKLDTRYVGAMDKGRIKGKGLLTILANGARYEGEWADNLPEGQGKYTTADGQVCEGAWSHGRLQGCSFWFQ